MCSRQANDPQLENSSIIHASSVTRPSRSGKPPSPTEVSFGSPSGTWTPASTASSARPFLDKIFQASAFAPTPKFQVEITIGLVTAFSRANNFCTDASDASTVDDWMNFLRDVLISLLVNR